MKYVLALDQGTTSSRAILFDRTGSIVAVGQKEFQQNFPQAGWVEHDPEEIWTSQRDVAYSAMQTAKAQASDIAAIGIANQRETTVVWNRSTGECLYPAIVWQDRRTADFCEQLKSQSHAQRLLEKTGLVIDAYFSATKIRWILDHVPGARDQADQGELACGTIDSWLLWKLTHGKLHVTDPSNASRTMLYNLQSAQWDHELLELFQIPRSMMADVVPSSQIYGSTDASLFGIGIPIAGMAGDQQAALYGQNCIQHGMAKNTYGTGCFMLMHIGSEFRCSQNRLLTTATCQRENQPQEYALEGSVFVAGAAIQWLRDGLGIIKSSSEVESLAASVPDSDGVYLVPALAGLGAPHWDAYARGIMIGMTRGTTRAHIARAALEGIAFQVADVLDAMRRDAGIELQQLRVDGGASANNLLMQTQADLLQAPVVRPKVVETTALGAAFLAGLAVGFWQDAQQVEQVWQTDRVFEPKLSADEIRLKRSRWSEALKRCKEWAQG